MVPDGIFVRAGCGDLAGQVVRRLDEWGPLGLRISEPEEKDPGENRVRLRFSRWSEAWYRIEFSGAPEGARMVLDVLVEHDPFEEVLAVHANPGIQEYGYALFREGRLLERFDIKGPGVESIHFVSDLREVPLQSLMSASRFMADSLGSFGIVREKRPDHAADGTSVDLILPGKPTFLQSLLGAAARR